MNIFGDLIKLARERKERPVEGSYTNKLLDDRSLSKSKVLEEINEAFNSPLFFDKINKKCLKIVLKKKILLLVTKIDKKFLTIFDVKLVSVIFISFFITLKYKVKNYLLFCFLLKKRLNKFNFIKHLNIIN